MFKHLLLAATMVASAAVAQAQRDITPDRFKFSQLAEGSQLVLDDYFGAPREANPPTGYIPSDGSKDAAGWLIINNNPTYSNRDNIQSALNIATIEDGSKALVFKGMSSTYPYGKAAAGSIGGWFNMSFYPAYNALNMVNTNLSEKMRFRMVLQVHQNQVSETANFLGNFQMQTNAGTNTEIAGSAINSGMFIERYEDDNSPVLDENDNYIFDHTKWYVVEGDVTAGSDAGLPLRLKLSFPGGVINGGALIVKELTMTALPTGTPYVGPLAQDPHATNIRNIADERAQILVGQGSIEVGSVKGTAEVFNLQGAKVATLTNSNNKADLASGIYIVKANNKSTKVVVK